MKHTKFKIVAITHTVRHSVDDIHFVCLIWKRKPIDHVIIIRFCRLSISDLSNNNNNNNPVQFFLRFSLLEKQNDLYSNSSRRIIFLLKNCKTHDIHYICDSVFHPGFSSLLIYINIFSLSRFSCVCWPLLPASPQFFRQQQKIKN